MIGRRALLWGLLALVLGCAPPAEISTAPPVEEASLRDVYVARFRHDTGQLKNFGEARPDLLAFQRMRVSIPPTHQPGQIEWPRGEPDARRHVVTIDETDYDTLAALVRAVAASDHSGYNETVIHVHGYNTTHAEAVYGTAQVGYDLDVPVPMVVFSWPSAAQVKGYVYDRDSALISRDLLEELIVAFAEQPGRKLFLTAHSMGSYLLMETLRQIAISGRVDLAEKINGVVLMAPDLDTELFRRQAERIGKLPEPFMLMIAEQDRALRISRLIGGSTVRLGTLTDYQQLRGLPVTVVDIGSLSDGRRFDHNIATTSPAALAILRRLNEVTPPGELPTVAAVIRADQADSLIERIRTGQ